MTFFIKCDINKETFWNHFEVQIFQKEEALKQKILLVDDDTGVSDIFVAIFDSGAFPGYEIVVQKKFEEGMGFALDHKGDFCAVLLDGQIEAGQGWQIAEALRLAGYQGIIFSVAGRALCDAVPANKRWAFNGWFQKPVPIRELIGKLQDEWL